MPVLYEGTWFSASSSPSPPHHHHLSPTRHTDIDSVIYFSILDPLPLLCVFAAFSALLSLYLQIRGRAPSARHDPSRILNQKLAFSRPPPPPLPLAAENYSDEKHEWREPERSTSLAASYYDLQDDLGMDMSSSATTAAAAAVAATSITSSLTEEPAEMSESEMWTREAWEAQIEAREKSIERVGNGSDNGTSTGNGSSKGMNTGAMDLSPPVRRRSYTKTKTREGQGDVVHLNVQEEIVVAEGWRRHTRVYGGGVCLACAESEKKMKSMTA